MAPFNSNNSSLPSFFLMGILGSHAVSLWISVPLCSLYLLSLLGNGLILFIIKTDKQLYVPMYLFLAMLAATDLSLNLTTIPTVLGVLLFDFRNIHFHVCLTQLYFIHSLSSMGSAILVAMAFDRYVAICNPLRYASILHPLIAKLGLAGLTRSVCLMFPLPFLLKRLPYCDKNSLSHPFCYHVDVMKLACADTTVNSVYGLVIVMCTFVIDSIFILSSYLMILKTVLGIASKEEGLRALSTCVSHILVVLVFYISLIGLTFAHRYGEKASPLLPVLLGFFYMFIPPALNPIIFSIKTKQIRNALRKHF